MKRFSQLAFPYIVWAALMLVLPMGLIAMYSFMEQGNSIISFSFTLEHYVKFFTDRGKDDGYLPAARLPGGIFHRAQR